LVARVIQVVSRVFQVVARVVSMVFYTVLYIQDNAVKITREQYFTRMLKLASCNVNKNRDAADMCGH